MHWIQKPNRCPYLYTIWVLTIVLFNQLWVGCWLGIVVFWDKAAKATKTLHKLTPLTFSNFSAKILQAFSSEAPCISTWKEINEREIERDEIQCFGTANYYYFHVVLLPLISILVLFSFLPAAKRVTELGFFFYPLLG